MERDGYYLGIDGGGSRCRATLSTVGGEIICRGFGGPANPFQSIGRAIESIENATAEAVVNAGLCNRDLDCISAGIGLAGVNVPTFYRAINTWRHPYRRMFLTTDMEIACIGAHNGDDGAVIVAGTGSCGYSMIDGKSRILGAHGFPFDDKGGGAWFGLEAVRAVLLATDKLGPRTSLTELIGERLALNGTSVVEVMAGAGSRRFAELASLVFDAADEGDSVATKIIQNGANYLSKVAKKLMLAEPPRISLLGGLREQVRPWLDADVVASLSPPLHQPDVGALLFVHSKISELAWRSTGTDNLRIC